MRSLAGSATKSCPRATSTARPAAPGVIFAHSAATDFAEASFRSAGKTIAPSPANRLAIAAPRPDPPPVMSAVPGPEALPHAWRG